MHDLDFLVKQDDFKRAASVIQKLGYTFSKDDFEYTPEFAELFMGEIPYRKGFVVIDLHWSLTAMGWYRRTTNFNLENMWENAVLTTVGNTNTLRLCLEDELIHLCYHTAVHHGLAHGPGYRDIHGLLELERDSIDWGRLAERARSWRVRIAVWSAFAVVRTFDADAVPVSVMDDLGVPKWRQAVLRPMIERVQNGNRVLASGSMRFLGLLLVDRMRDLPFVLFRGLFPGRLWLKMRFNLSDFGAFWRQLTYPLAVLWNGIKAIRIVRTNHPGSIAEVDSENRS